MRIGFVGLGNMGSRIAGRMLEGGHELVVHNRTRAKAEPLIACGAQWRNSPREVAAEAEAVFTMVSEPAALAAVTDGPDGILAGIRGGSVYVDLSTVSPMVSRRLAERVREKGADMLDAPVSGSPVSIEEGKLSFMVGGKVEVLERVRPVLESLGSAVTHVGGNGQGSLMKLATNLSIAVQFMVFCEGVVLAEKGGIPRDRALQVLLNSAMASPMLKYRGPMVIKGYDPGIFDVNMMQKDLNLALEVARTLDVPLPTTAATNEVLTATRALGMADKDFAAMFETLSMMAGMRSRS
ncbi:MAG TPA: NAD(P)-dependent oxidoreductase [Candidatus Acidoferrales bacterium]|nr:NAD(P)-dependent oxidoreductase [Candidatus Acidoferrales bacterium]